MESRIMDYDVIPSINSLRQNICRLFLVLAQFIFNTCETKLDYYQQKVNEQVTGRVPDRLKS